MQRNAGFGRLRSLTVVVISAVLTPALLAGVMPETATAASTSFGALDRSTGAAPPPSREPSPIIIDEVAAGGARSDADSFFELRNNSSDAVDLTGWEIYRCSDTGLRSNDGRPEADLTGVVLAPDDTFTAAHVGMSLAGEVAPDAVFTQRYSPEGFGLYLKDPQGRLRDAIGVYPREPWPTQSECSGYGNVPNSLAFALDDSWQRVDSSGDAHTDWVRGPASPGASAVTPGEPARVPAVRISEVAGGGPGGWGDDVIELHNTGEDAVSLGGWLLYRCTALGVASADTVQVRFADDAALAPDERLVIGGPSFTDADGAADLTMTTSLASGVSGVLLTTSAGERVDGVTVSNHPDTACQMGATKLPSTLDYRTGESWQRDAQSGTFRIAPRTPGTAPRPGKVTSSSSSSSSSATTTSTRSAIAISEFATDPIIEPAPAGYEQHNFVELANYGTAGVDISGWRLIACGADGFRRTDTVATVAANTLVAPGETWMAALEGTAQASTADAVFEHAFDFLGAGVWLEDGEGRRVDRVGVYHSNEMDFSIDRVSPCRNGMSPATFAVDRLIGETFQRIDFGADDASNFVAGVATPGAIDDGEGRAAGMVTAQAWGRIAAGSRADEDRADEDRADADRADADAAHDDTAADRTAADSTASVTVALAAAPQPARIVEAFTGASARGALTTRSGAGESRTSPEIAALATADDAYDFPYVRLRLATDGDTALGVSWAGTTEGRGELHLSVWSERTKSWRLLDSASASTPGGLVPLDGEARVDEISGGLVDVLVQSAPRLPVGSGTADAAAAQPAGDGFADVADYDFAISHITDTQYLSEAYPDVYAELAAWVVANQKPRKIAFATHTGDLIQNWVDSDQNQDRARFEFDRASRIQKMLDDADVPNSVLPGNHDNKRGMTNDLFNEYFPPSRYSEKAWFGGSIAPDDNSANFSTFQAQGANFLMLSLPYGYGEREIAWAEDVVAEHPRHNVVISTHEHVTPSSPDSPTSRSVSSRWVSRAGQLFDRVIAPNRNVVLVLSGHFHGLGRLVTENAGGIEGHTVVELLADYQEFRTDTGERATGFQRLLQVDLGSGTVFVDTFSSTLGAHHSFPYDYPQVIPENGDVGAITNTRPWNVIREGQQDWYTGADDDFEVRVSLQYPKSVVTQGVTTTTR